VTIVLYAIEIVAYTLMGSGEEQAWNKGEVKTEDAETAEVTPLNVREGNKQYNSDS
jgi:MFS transporter, ACS family, solute carrier family 17 (sodium-dependent inorganic phosphate cotransporter), other